MGHTVWYLVVLGQYNLVCLVLSSTGPVQGGTGQYLVVLDQLKAVMVGTWWYWVSMGQYRLGVGGTASLWSRTG